MSSPTQRSLAKCRKEGQVPWIVEHFNFFSKLRHDLWGFADLLVIDEAGGQLIAIQTTSGGNVSKRLHKIRNNKYVRGVMACGVRVEVHGWRKSAKTKRWECRVVVVTPETIGEMDKE